MQILFKKNEKLLHEAKDLRSQFLKVVSTLGIIGTFI